VFHQENYINLLKLLVTSISVKANLKNDTDILIVTSPSFQPLIQKELENFDLPLQYYILDLHTLFEAGYARLNIFKYDSIAKYDTILYLDTDILINSDINVLLNLDISSEKVYALEEGTISHDFYGGMFFDFSKYDTNTTAFTSGILFFRNSECVKVLFESIQAHIVDYIDNKKNSVPKCLDQPFIVYNAISQNKYDNQLLKKYVENNPSGVSVGKIVYHFPGGPGAYDSKILKMTDFWEKICKVNRFCTILNNKQYSWQNDSIIFLENGCMNAFGKGSYTQLDTYTFRAHFGSRIHIVVFNSDYTEFTSTREGDGEIIKGVIKHS
jgi:lipopolysaccharide biosynthesis glycosyltransferase